MCDGERLVIVDVERERERLRMMNEERVISVSKEIQREIQRDQY